MLVVSLIVRLKFTPNQKEERYGKGRAKAGETGDIRDKRR